MSLPVPWCIGVVIPARNEAGSIERCIESVRDSHLALAQPAGLWIVVVADSCTDDTVGRARAALSTSGQVLECQARSAGAARTLGVNAVIGHFAGCAAETIWLANTDADSHVPTDWLSRHLDFADCGITGVAGVVDLEPTAAKDCAVQKMFRDTYQVAADGSHTHVHGANLGVRADAYLAVGGWGALALAEDHCLWNRLKSAGWRLRSSAQSRVTTSARLHGRAAGGFADTLNRQMASGRA